MFVDIVCCYLVCIVLFGFVVGVIVVVYIVEWVGFLDIIIGDMGGISFDVLFVIGGILVLLL